MGENLEPLDLGLDEEEGVAGPPHQALRAPSGHRVVVRHQAHLFKTTSLNS